jgi:hypothetical protein
MSWLSDFLHPKKAYNGVQDQLTNSYNQAQGYTQPFYDAFSNPQALEDKWSKGYQESDIAKQAEATASQNGLNAAQQMGLGGSTPALQAIQAGTSGIVAQDRQQYLNDLMQKYMAGAGIGQNMGQNAMNFGQNSAQTQFNQNNAQGSLFGNLLGAGTGLFGSILGGKSGWNPFGNHNFGGSNGS